MSVKDIKNYSLEELGSFLSKNGYPKFYARQIFEWVYKKRIYDFSLMSNISKTARRFLKTNFYFSQLELLKEESSRDGTRKFLFRLNDKDSIETVLIPEGQRNTLCISSQVGCRFKCAFCASGEAGFRRNLEVSEIINQYLSVSPMISPHLVTNIVFMGIGEPLDNFKNTITAIRVFMEPVGIHFGKRRICVSTCGLIPKISQLAKLDLDIKFSLSLHSADQAIRTQLMPINKKYPLKELMKAVRTLAEAKKYPITFEYVLIHALNTKKEDALKLAKLLKGMHSKVNLICYNGDDPVFRVPSPEEVSNFENEMEKNGIFFTLRKSRGQDINAACGQLRARLALR